MSWSISLRGKAAELVTALEENSAKLSGQSKIEYDEAMPHLVALVKQNFENRPDRQQFPLRLDAHGSGTSHADTQLERSCSVTLVTGS